jgi:single-strand DNA-binding protein
MTENQFIVAGYLGSKPELRQLPSGTDVANARLAQSYMLLGKNEERTNWFNLTFYGKLAHVAMQFEKGDNIHITAFLEHREWETKAGGKRNTYEVVVKKCHRIASAKAQCHAAEEDNLGPDSSTVQGTEGALARSQTDDGWVV